MSKILNLSRSLGSLGGYHYLGYNGSIIRTIAASLLTTSSRGAQQSPEKAKKAPVSLAFKNMSSLEDDDENSDTKKRVENISRAMAYYIKQISERDALMKFKTEEYEIGKRHLAHMMGQDPENFTQDDIDEAIKYLLPSGLFSKKARPFFKHPEDYYPKSKVAAFGNDGRPLHSFFYTGCSDYYQLLYDITQKLLNLNKLEDTMNLVKEKMKTFIKEDDELREFSKIDQTGSEWISYPAFCKKFNIKIDEMNYKRAIFLLQKLADHPLSKKEEEFIMQFKNLFESPIKLTQIPECLMDKNGRKYQEINSNRHTTHVKVRLYEGTGQVNINCGERKFDICYFEVMTHREQILFPFKVIDQINKFDVNVEVYNEGGMSGMAKAIRYGISRALCGFISADAIEKLRLAGLLVPDQRPKERKKPGQLGARRKYTWLKR